MSEVLASEILESLLEHVHEGEDDLFVLALDALHIDFPDFAIGLDGDLLLVLDGDGHLLASGDVVDSRQIGHGSEAAFEHLADRELFDHQLSVLNRQVRTLTSVIRGSRAETDGAFFSIFDASIQFALSSFRYSS